MTVSTRTIVGGGGEFAVGGADGDLPHAVIGPRAAHRAGKGERRRRESRSQQSSDERGQTKRVGMGNIWKPG